MSRRRPYLASVAVGSLCLAFLFAVRAQMPVPVPTPKIRAIDLVDFGEQEIGQVATGQVVLANDGEGVLKIGGVRTSCSCAGLELKDGAGKYRQIDELSLQPGEAVTAHIRLGVNGAINDSAGKTITFSTNDPESPEVAVHVRVSRITYGLRASPDVLSFGIVNSGDSIIREVDVVDYATEPRAISKIATSNPAQIQAEIVSSPENATKQFARGRHLGRIRVAVNTMHSGNVDGQLTIWVASNASTHMSTIAVRVSGRVSPMFEVFPATIVLPLQSENGPVNQAAVLCRAGNRSSIRVAQCPPEYSVTIQDVVSESAPKRILIERKSDFQNSGEAEIVLAATQNGIEYLQPVKIHYRP
jgi:hypothetical protein